MHRTNDLNGQQLYRLARTHELPEYVKDASSNQVYGDDNLPSRCYGNPAARSFPHHTRAATWVSYALLRESKEAMAPDQYGLLRDQLRKMAHFWNIAGDLDAVDGSASSGEKQASASTDDFALVLPLPTGGQECRYPLRNASEVKAAAAYLRQHRDALPYALRRGMADRVLIKAAAYGVQFDEPTDAFLERQAGHGWCAASDAAGLLRERALLLRRVDPDSSKALVQAADACQTKSATARDPERLQVLAEAIDRIDRANGLHREYGPGLPRPEDVLFGLTVKSASAAADEHCSTTSGCVYRTEDLGRVKLAVLRDTFGDAFADNVSAGGLLVDAEKLAEQLHTLPRPDAELMDRLLEEMGVKPVAKEAAHQGSWLTPEVLRRLAEV